uniref:Uncharacterized protein n=1 Tax=viral metagenome TaxID=1070528 RepID=A0A6C0BRA2_9ZZZZ
MKNMYPHFKMLSPYIFIIYFLSYISNKRNIVTLFTPLMWIVSIFGIIILLYRRFYKKNIIYSIIFYKLFNIKSDIPLIILKVLTIMFLYHEPTKLTRDSLLLSFILIAVYSYVIDIEDTYLSEM